MEKTAELKHQPDIDKAILQLFDREAFYFRLCSHHDKREADFLYPTLEEILTDVEKHDLLARIDLKAEIASVHRRHEHD